MKAFTRLRSFAQPPRREGGFTLIEVLTVIIIISILIGVIYVSFQEVRENARNKALQSSLKEAQLALELYKAQNGAYPLPGSQVSGCFVLNNGLGRWFTQDVKGNNGDGGDCGDRSWIPGLVPQFLDELPLSKDHQTEFGCRMRYKAAVDGSGYKLVAERCVEGVDENSGVQPGDEFATCPLSCGSGGNCPSVDGGVYDSDLGYASYAVYRGDGACY